MRRITGLLLAVLLSVSMAACSQATPTATSSAQPTTAATATTEAAKTDAPTAAPTTAPDPMGKYAEPITVTAVRSLGATGLELPTGDTLENNVWSRAYESVLGIKIKYLWTTNDAQYTQKLNIAITSDDLPDIMPANAAQLKMLVDNGQAEEISGVVKDYSAKFTNDVLIADGGRGFKSATFNGGLYAIPQAGTGLGSAQVLWVRTDWLKKLNLQAPKTMDDLLAVADAFTNKDPDGNGKADTFGLGINKDLYGSYAAMEGFFNSYGAYPNIWIKDASGNLVNGSIQPEMKTALAKLQQMYSGKLLDKEFGVKDANKVNEDVAAGKIGMFYGQFWNGAWFQDAKIKNPTMEWVPVAIPTATGSPAKVSVPFGVSTYYVVKKGSEHPEAAVKMLNLELEKIYGTTAEPNTYSIDDAGHGLYQCALLYCEPYKKNFVAAVKVTAALASKDTSKLNLEEMDYYKKDLQCLAGDYTCWHNYKMFGTDGTLTIINNYDLNKQTMDNEYFGAPTPAMSEKGSTLDKLQLTDFTDIIMGASIDGFDKFVTDWNNLGGTQMTTEVNDWYKTQK